MDHSTCEFCISKIQSQNTFQYGKVILVLRLWDLKYRKKKKNLTLKCRVTSWALSTNHGFHNLASWYPITKVSACKTSREWAITVFPAIATDSTESQAILLLCTFHWKRYERTEGHGSSLLLRVAIIKLTRCILLSVNLQDAVKINEKKGYSVS